MKPISERASLNFCRGSAHPHNHRSSLSEYFSKAAEQLEAAAARVRLWCPPPLRVCATRKALSAVCVAAALLAAAAVVLVPNAAVRGGTPNVMPASLFFKEEQMDTPNGMPASLFFDDEQGLGDMFPSIDHLLDGLLTSEFRYGSCRSRYEFASYHKKSSHKPSPYLLAKIREQEALQKQYGPGTASYKKAVRRLESGEGVPVADANNSNDCRYLVYINYQGLGNRMLAIASAFVYAVLTGRVLLIDGSKNVADLFCEPFPGTTWLLPRSGWRGQSPLGRLTSFRIKSNESLGNMLKSGAAVSADGGNVSWSSMSTPPYVYLHLAGGYGYHDQLFYCGAHQQLLRSVPWLLMRTDSYIVPGLFLMPPFRNELGAMFPEKDTVFHHLGRYLFHPSNAVWHAITSYYRSNLAGAGRRVGIQIRVFRKDQPRQSVLDQILSCIHDKELLPGAAATSNTSILVTSLSSWYSERIRDEYGAAAGVHQPSHEGRQRVHNTTHDMRALSEMYLLSMCDVLITSGSSTFGYVAQGLAGVRPWVMARTPIWGKHWREELDPRRLPCWRMASVEPCFHSPSTYDCTAGRDVELDKVTPYVKSCEDVRWGIQLVNESGSLWW